MVICLPSLMLQIGGMCGCQNLGKTGLVYFYKVPENCF